MSDNYEVVTINGRQRPAHDVIEENIIGRPLAEDEVVHHINGDKRDNRPENLKVMKRSAHTSMHKRGEVFTPESLDKMSRSHSGVRSQQRKLTDEQVTAIVQKLLKGASLKALGREYGVNPRTIAGIRDEKNYSDITSKIPGVELPLDVCRRETAAREVTRKLDFWEITDIRVRLLNRESLHSVAKRYGISNSMVRDIRDGKAYSDIPWPKENARYRVMEDMTELVNMLLDRPLPMDGDEEQVLMRYYGVCPTTQAVYALKMVRRAMAGDRELGVFLFSMSRHAGEIGEMIRENSVFLEYFASSDLSDDLFEITTTPEND